MKNPFVFAMICMVAIFLSACSNSSTSPATPSNSVNLHIKNNTNAAIYGMEINWGQGEEAKGTQGGMNADGSKIKKGESMWFELDQADVESGEDLQVELTLVTSPNSKTKVPLDSIPITLSGHGDYYYEIVSDSDGTRLIKSKK